MYLKSGRPMNSNRNDCKITLSLWITWFVCKHKSNGDHWSPLQTAKQRSGNRAFHFTHSLPDLNFQFYIL